MLNGIRRLSACLLVVVGFLTTRNLQAEEPAKTNAQLVAASLEERKTFESHDKEFRDLAARLSREKSKLSSEQKDAAGKTMLAIELPFQESLNALMRRIKQGEDRIAAYPGLLALGPIKFDERAGIYTLTVLWGYGSYELSDRLFPRYFGIRFDLDGKILKAGPAPVMETR